MVMTLNGRSGVFGLAQGPCPDSVQPVHIVYTMAKRATQAFRIAPLQRLTVKPIEDPGEQAAIEERLKRGEEAMAAKSVADAGNNDIRAKNKNGAAH